MKPSYRDVWAELGRRPEPNEYHFEKPNEFDDDLFLRSMLELFEEEKAQEASR